MTYNKEYAAAYYAAHREEQAAKQRARRAADPEKFRARKRAQYLANPDKAKVRAKNWYEANHERALAREKEWKEANPEYMKAWRAANPKKVKAHKEKYRATHREALALRERERNAANPEKKKAADRAYRLANPEKPAEARHRRRARKTGNGVWVVTPRDLRRLLLRWNNACAYCGITGIKLTWDHVIPIALGGRHSIGNLVPACGPCNSSKGPKLFVVWQAQRRKSVLA